MRRDLARLRALSPVERRLLARALVLLPLFAIGVRFGGLRRARRWMRGLGAIEGATVPEVVRMAHVAARRAPWKDGCLPAALMLHRLLAAQGIDSELRLGVRKAGARFEAHAWVERGGERIFDIDAGSGGFAALEPVKGRA